MNILFIFEVDYIKKVVYDMHMLVESMSLRGHNVYAIDYEDTWERNGLSPKEQIVSRVFDGAKVHLIRSGFIRVAGLSRLSTSFMQIGLIKRIIKEKQIDAIVLYSVPTNGLQTVYWAKKLGVPVVFRSLDVLHQLVRNPILRPITKFIEKMVYSQVDIGLTISPKLSEYMQDLGTKRTHVLPMPVDTSAFYPFKSNIGKKWGITDDDKVILFLGTLYDFSGLDWFICKFRSLLWEVRKAKLLIVGDGEQKRDLRSLIQIYGLQDKVIITGFQPYEDMPEYVNAADVCILPFEINQVTKDIFPGKIVQFLACAKPLVSTSLPGVRAVIPFGEAQGVQYVDGIGEMEEAVVQLLNNDNQCEMLGAKGWAYAMQFHDVWKVAGELEGILGELC